MAGKAKIVDEVWDDERVRSFLSYEPYKDNTQIDFEVLYQAYIHMRSDDFRRFLVFFVEQGRDLNAKNSQGCSLASIISHHRLSAPFVEALTAAGATPPSTEENRQGATVVARATTG